MANERQYAFRSFLMTATACWLVVAPLHAQEAMQGPMQPVEVDPLRPETRPSTHLRPQARSEPPNVSSEAPEVTSETSPTEAPKVALIEPQIGSIGGLVPPAPPIFQQITPLPIEATAPPTKRDVADVRTAGFSAARYTQDRAMREAAFVAAQNDTDRIHASMDIAQLFIAHMLLPEAKDYLRTAQSLGVLVDEEQDARWHTLTLYAEILSGDAPSPEMLATWKLPELWRLVQNPESAADGADLTLAISQLQHHSESVVAELIPSLFEAALIARDLRSADALVRGARDATHLSTEPVMDYMFGRLALAYDMPKDAFDYFAKGSSGRDLYAQRSRIALADLALTRQDPKLLPALADILAEGVNQWRHGQEALILRARLAQVAEDLGDIPLALDIMGNIRTDHPNTAESILAHERGALALAAFAVAVDSEEIDISTYLNTMREVEPFYRLDPIWPIARVALAKAWARKGLHEAAAAEMAALEADLLRIGAPKAQERVAAEIPILEAEQWLATHNMARARLALAREGLPQFSDLSERYTLAAIQAQAPGAFGQPMNFADIEGFRIYARGARMAGLYANAHAAHRALDSRNALASELPEALEAITLGYDLAENDFAKNTYSKVQETPEGRASLASPALNEALAVPMPDLSLLARDTADAMLSRTNAALEATRSLLSTTPPVTAPAPQSTN